MSRDKFYQTIFKKVGNSAKGVADAIFSRFLSSSCHYLQIENDLIKQIKKDEIQILLNVSLTEKEKLLSKNELYKDEIFKQLSRVDLTLKSIEKEEHPDEMRSFSHSFRRLHPISSRDTPFIVKTSRRFCSIKSQKSVSTTIFHPCIDIIFQYGFKSIPAMISFLNAVLDFKGETEIQTIEHVKKDMPSANPDSRYSYGFTVNLKCQTKDGHHFLVKMQNDFHNDYNLKILKEHSIMISTLNTELSVEDIEKRKLKTKTIKLIFGRMFKVSTQ